MCVLLSCVASGIPCLDVTASGSQREKEEGGGAKFYVAPCQVAAFQRMLKVRRMSSPPVRPLRLHLCCSAPMQKSNKDDKCVG